MIKVQKLFYDYGGRGQYAVREVSFTIGDGEIFGFLGPSGAGKSTVQNLITGILPLQQGEVNYDGVSLQEGGRAFFNKIGVSFEHPNLYPALTGLENLKYYRGFFAGPTQDPLTLMERVGLGEAAHKKTREYSRGMKQRLVLARSLLNQPHYLFLDEPTSGLDPNTAEQIREIIREKKKECGGIFLTTHNMHLAAELCDRVALLNNGEIVAGDTPRNLQLEYGERAFKAEYSNNGELQEKVFFPEREKDRQQLKDLIASNQVQTLHSQEASLEQVFIRLTGRELA